MLLTIRDVSSILQVSESTVHRWIQEKGLPIQRNNGHHRMSPVHLLEWLAENQVPIKSEVFPSVNGANAAPRLDDALKAGGIHAEIDGSNKSTALAAIVRCLPSVPGLSADDLLVLMQSREEAGSTYIGDGIAVPHPRFPLIHATFAPTLLLSYLRTPVAWTSDGKSVHTLFVLVCPTVRSHLRLLARLMFALNAPGFRGAVNRKAPGEEVLAMAEQFESASALPSSTNGVHSK